MHGGKSSGVGGGAWVPVTREENQFRVALVNAMTGERWALPDVGEEDNYTIPTWAFQVEELTQRKTYL